MDRLSLQELREQLPVTEEVGYFQTGTYGSTLSSALKAVRDAMEYEACTARRARRRGSTSWRRKRPPEANWPTS